MMGQIPNGARGGGAVIVYLFGVTETDKFFKEEGLEFSRKKKDEEPEI